MRPAISPKQDLLKKEGKDFGLSLLS